jgi:hypothetical protein
MVRTQIQLTERQARKLRARARERGVSVAELIRRCVEASLSEKEPSRAELYTRASRLAGKFEDRKGARDLSRRHDEYLDEAFE